MLEGQKYNINTIKEYHILKQITKLTSNQFKIAFSTLLAISMSICSSTPEFMIVFSAWNLASYGLVFIPYIIYWSYFSGFLRTRSDLLGWSGECINQSWPFSSP